VFFGRRRDDLADAPPQVAQEGEMTGFLAQMPTDTMIFLTMAVLSFAAVLIVLRWLI
jgi:hypothetical protein